MENQMFTPDVIETYCANIQTLYTRATRLPEVTHDVARHALALLLFLEMKVPHCGLVAEIVNISNPKKPLWGINGGCCGLCQVTTLEELIIEANKAVNHLRMQPNMRPQDLDTMLLQATRQTIKKHPFSISNIFSNEDTQKQFNDGLLHCDSLCAPLHLRPQQEQGDPTRYIDIIEYRTLQIESEKPIQEAQILEYVESNHGPCVESLIVAEDDIRKAKMILKTPQDATQVMGGTVGKSVLVKVRGKNLTITRTNSDIL